MRLPPSSQKSAPASRPRVGERSRGLPTTSHVECGDDSTAISGAIGHGMRGPLLERARHAKPAAGSGDPQPRTGGRLAAFALPLHSLRIRVPGPPFHADGGHGWSGSDIRTGSCPSGCLLLGQPQMNTVSANVWPTWKLVAVRVAVSCSGAALWRYDFGLTPSGYRTPDCCETVISVMT